ALGMLVLAFSGLATALFHRMRPVAPLSPCRRRTAGTLRGNAVSRPRVPSLRRVPAPFPWYPYHPFESIRRG
ncbi:hypothetical protein JTM36_33455, partial [Pseudomonas aeruginosa]|nr:hypothetical protein [Pseudomonas aeruginosa]